MKKLLFSIIALTLVVVSFGQNLYITKTGHAYFMSHTDAIDIDGDNNQVTSIFNNENGDIVFQLLIKSFKFSLATAEEHFNETYMESDKFPKAKFKGSVVNLNDINFSKDGSYSANVKGDLTIHGVTQQIEQTGMVKIKDGVISANAEFEVNISDFDIKVPKMVKERVAKVVNIKVDFEYKPYEK